MVYESSTRRIYSSASPRPAISTSYSYSTPSARTYSYTVSDPPSTAGSTTRRVETVTRTVRSSDSSLGGPSGRGYSTTTESTSRDDGYGPRTSTFTSERSIGGPGGASYFSTASYKSPYPVGPIPVVTKLRRHPHLVLAYSPGSGKGHVINPLAIPRCATRRLVSIAPPPRRPQNSHNYYDTLDYGSTGHYGNRIVLVRYRPTPTPAPQSTLYIEDVTDSNHYGKETRLVRRELSPAYDYGYGSPWDTASSAMVPFSRPLFSLHNIPLRSASEVKEIADMRRLYVRARNPDVGYSPINKALLYRMPMPVYVDPTLPQSYYIGRGNLACLSFAGGRAIPKRRRFYPDYEDKVRDEVIFRSFYSKLRDAASFGRNAGRRPIYQPIHYSRKTILGAENVPKREPKESKWVERALANEKPPTPRAKPAPVATETVVAPPRKESLKLERKPATPPSVQPVNITLPGPRKSVTEIVREDLPRVENLPEQEVTVKIPKEPEPAPITPPVEAKKTVVVPAKKAEAAPPPRELTPPPPKEPTPPPKEPTPPPPKELTPPPPKEPTPPPPREPTPPPPKEPTPPPPKEPTPPPSKEPTPPPVEAPVEVAASTEESPAAAVVEAPALASEPVSEVADASSQPKSEQASGDADEASNKGEVEDIQLDEEITLDEVCDVEENDLEIEADDPGFLSSSNFEAAQPETTAESEPVESPQETKGSAEPAVVEAAAEVSVETPVSAAPEPAAAEDISQTPANDQDAVPPAQVSIVVADIDGPIPPEEEETSAVQGEPQSVEQIQAEAERRRAEFAQLLEEHAELVTTVTKLERVATIVSKSCAEALAQQEQQPPPS